jgi:hypothetical protein
MSKINLDVIDFVNFIDYLKVEIEKDAAEAELNAGLGGHHHDGGARDMRNELNIYLMALNKEIPDQWKKHLKEFTFKTDLEKDPEYKDEYAEFLRLQEKFGDKHART